MIQKIKKIILTASTAAVLALGMAVPATVMAVTCTANTPGQSQQDCINANLCSGSNFNTAGSTNNLTTADCGDAKNGSNTIGAKIKTLLNVLSAIVGVLAVLMIIYAGFRYVTSAGSEAGIKAAKGAIIYAIIGLVVVALAQVIVHFVISNVTS